MTTADRSFGAGLTGALERGELHGPIRLELVGAAGQSFGAFAGPGVELRLVGQANDYVAKGLAGGTITVAPEPDLAADAASEAIAGNTVLYGAMQYSLSASGPIRFYLCLLLCYGLMITSLTPFAIRSVNARVIMSEGSPPKTFLKPQSASRGLKSNGSVSPSYRPRPRHSRG